MHTCIYEYTRMYMCTYASKNNKDNWIRIYTSNNSKEKIVVKHNQDRSQFSLNCIFLFIAGVARQLFPEMYVFVNMVVESQL